MTGLDSCIGFLVNNLARQFKKGMNERLAPYEITVAQWTILARLWEQDGVTQKDLAKSLQLEGSTIVWLIDKLEKKRFVVRKTLPADRRSTQIFLTPAGKRLRDELPAFHVGLDEIATASASAAEVEGFYKLLRLMSVNLRNYQPAEQLNDE
ncbi:MAG: MarR family transcriptional regulator [Candidatus Tectomicrobia bacterium]|nr:MarR family transcriptional regulator [Candidatus Tectomicrobia bacterium]